MMYHLNQSNEDFWKLILRRKQKKKSKSDEYKICPIFLIIGTIS